eukprot:6257476-Pyramimonas_sp.AAC.1
MYVLHIHDNNLVQLHSDSRSPGGRHRHPDRADVRDKGRTRGDARTTLTGLLEKLTRHGAAT